MSTHAGSRSLHKAFLALGITALVAALARPAAAQQPSAHVHAGRTTLRGTLLRSSDLAPVVGERILFRFGERTAEAMTDGEGRFATGAVVPAGVVRAECIGPKDFAGFLPRRALFPTWFCIPEGAAAAPDEYDIELLLGEPASTLAVQVRQDGAAVRSQVLVSATSPSARRIGWIEETDGSGRVQVPMDGFVAGTQVRLQARASGVLSRARFVALGQSDEEVTLALEPAGKILVHVLDTQRAPVRDAYVWLAEDDLGGHSDAAGLLVLDPVPLGLVTVLAEGVESQSVEVPATGQAEIVVWLEPSAQLVGGRVLDERGRALEGAVLTVSAAQGSASVVSRQDGRFALFAPPGRVQGPLRVTLAGTVEDERYEPAEVSVPLGANELVFERVPAPRAELVALLLDSRSNQPLEAGRLLLHREAFPEWSLAHEGRAGLVACALRPAADVRVVARAPGHRDLVFAWSELPEAARGGAPARLEFESGFAQALRVVDAVTGAPLAGARILAGEAQVAVTAADGRARVELPEWPATLRLTAEGYAETLWACAETIDDPLPTFALEKR